MDKPLEWIRSAQKDLREFPDAVKYDVGHALREAQQGGKPSSAKPLKGYKGAGILEIVDDYDTDTYRAVFTIKFKKAVYVLHCFQKKSKKGIETPKKEMTLINNRLKTAQEHYEKNY
ncbi:hypothetical protein MNBD_BACTEROID05-232 [hydrothermal vent metagenome]|uniref:Addiction module toxin RelE n=1 Tax=hydrothermal vent metagenome TaxID=652676 RepID=A0A3B0TKX7_9ZZZZ